MTLPHAVPLAVGGAAAFHWAPAAAGVLPGVARAFGIPRRLDRAGVLLSFDDGPHMEGTPAVLAELDRREAHAVFFVCGEQVDRHPAIVREIVAAGHELGLHGYRHQTRRQWTRHLLTDDAMRAIDAVGAATDSVPHLYRPPHGVFSLAGLRAIRQLGLEPLLWSKWGRDWEARATPWSIARRATTHIAGGDVILLHDADYYGARGSWRATVSALPLVFAALERAGLETEIPWQPDGGRMDGGYWRRRTRPYEDACLEAPTNESGATAEAPLSRRLPEGSLYRSTSASAAPSRPVEVEVVASCSPMSAHTLTPWELTRHPHGVDDAA